ncbi:hypothetical protein K466DRAFT_605334 [Polyporus arcularius HHB13444]|uniref:NADP-dependent oxidoreductase domain-containing protein n=1 Tax=Polyporus arcularius HHB13444 TaxID=1314778 RepID=A0A5C3NSW4_9APHY|nr:hypothetical protein K466DRAFT_605334 [Polyporus arcularius HHB13444]
MPELGVPSYPRAPQLLVSVLASSVLLPAKVRVFPFVLAALAHSSLMRFSRSPASPNKPRSWSPFSPVRSRKSSDHATMSNDVVSEYRQLGKSGLRVSVPIYGGMTFGNPQWSVCTLVCAPTHLLD